MNNRNVGNSIEVCPVDAAKIHNTQLKPNVTTKNDQEEERRAFMVYASQNFLNVLSQDERLLFA